MADASIKPKCKYWESCYRDNAQHRRDFLHPDVSSPGGRAIPLDVGTESTGSKTVLKGQKVVFTGALSKTRKQVTAEAIKHECIVQVAVTGSTTLVVAGADAGQKLDKAEKLGINILTESDWNNMLALDQPSTEEKPTIMEKNKTPVNSPTKHQVKVQKNKHHHMSESDSDADDSPNSHTKANAFEESTYHSAGKQTHDVSDSGNESDSDQQPSTSGWTHQKATPPKRNHALSDSSDDETTPRKVRHTLAKCRYWNSCYRKDPAHLAQFSHPSYDEEARGLGSDGVNNEATDISIKPKHAMADGESIEVPAESGDGTYRIKRTGDHYYCTCLAWRNQSAAVDSRTCKHLKNYLGVEFETERCGESGTRKNIPKTADKHIPQLLLAHKWVESTNPAGWWMSEKLDGVRAYWNGREMFSRLGNRFTPPEWFTKDFPTDMELNGELFGGRGMFQSTVSIVKSSNSDRWKNIKYQVFDCLSIGKQPFEQRLQILQDLFKSDSESTISVLDQTRCRGIDHLKSELARVEALRGEGLMIRKPASQYVNGRSNTLLKIKSFHDAEAIVIKHEPGKGKNTGLTGALRCRMECGKEFSVGTGLKDQDRRDPPTIGTIISYKFQEYTNDGIPRFPSYIGIRIDMSAPKDAKLLPKLREDE